MYEGMWRLPDLQTPSAVPSGFNPNILCLIPLFKDDYTRVENLEAFARMAIYSHWTCYQHTNALDEYIRVQFLVEECIADRVIPIFEQNFIDINKDVIFFTADPLEHSTDGSWGHLGKQMVPYWDKRFANYEWLFVWDADILFLPEISSIGIGENESLQNQMFTKIHDLPKRAGYIYVSYIEAEIMNNQLLSRLAKETTKTGISVDKLLEMSEVSKYRRTILKPSCCLWAYPAKHFHENHQDFIEWMQTYAPYWGNDEIIAGYWTNKFLLKVNVLSRELNILVNDNAYFFGAKPAGNILHGIIRLDSEKELREALYIS